MTATEYYASIKADRNAWRAEMPDRCMCCRRIPGKREPGQETVVWLEIHEMCSRAHLPNAWWFRAYALLLCHWCHPKVASMPHAQQLAIKKRMDERHYDLHDWLLRRNPNAMEYVTEAEVNRRMDLTR